MSAKPPAMPLLNVVSDLIAQACARLPKKMTSQEATGLLLTIGLQESEFRYRRQLGNGPAASFWQMERGGGIKGVLTHPATRAYAISACHEDDTMPTTEGVWTRMQEREGDVLSCIFARLLLWSSPHALPSAEKRDDEKAWTMYAVELWRPGKPHKASWVGYRDAARATIAAING